MQKFLLLIIYLQHWKVLSYVLTGGFLPMDVVFFSFSILFCDHQRLNYFLKIYSFSTL